MNYKGNARFCDERRLMIVGKQRGGEEGGEGNETNVFDNRRLRTAQRGCEKDAGPFRAKPLRYEKKGKKRKKQKEIPRNIRSKRK